MSDDFDMTAILGEFGITPVHTAPEEKPKKEPVRRKRVVAETLITQVEKMREEDEEKHAEKVRQFAESLKGKKIAKVKAFLTEIAKKKKASRRPPTYKQPTTKGDVLNLLVERGWTIPKEGVKAKARYLEHEPMDEVSNSRAILNPDKSVAYWFFAEDIPKRLSKESYLIARGPMVKEGDVYVFDITKRPYEYLEWRTKKEAIKKAEETQKHYEELNEERRKKGPQYVLIADPHKKAFEGIDRHIYLPETL